MKDNTRFALLITGVFGVVAAFAMSLSMALKWMHENDVRHAESMKFAVGDCVNDTYINDFEKLETYYYVVAVGENDYLTLRQTFTILPESQKSYSRPYTSVRHKSYFHTYNKVDKKFCKMAIEQLKEEK